MLISKRQLGRFNNRLKEEKTKEKCNNTGIVLNMNQNLVIKKTIDFVKGKLKNEYSGHDWWHVYRVWNNSLQIGAAENVDMFIVQLAALLHDIADWKFHGGDIMAGPQTACKFLKKNNVDENVIDHVGDIIKRISFKGAAVESKQLTQEGKVVQDADRLDALGAIGIARVFAYGGYKQREIYNPEIKPAIHMTFEQYQSNTSPTINHFYEKLLLLKDLMNTETGKKLAAERHAFMEEYLRIFYQEVEPQTKI